MLLFEVAAEFGVAASAVVKVDCVGEAGGEDDAGCCEGDGCEGGAGGLGLRHVELLGVTQCGEIELKAMNGCV